MIKKSTFISKKDIIPLWSNLPFFIPAGLAFTKGLWAYWLLIALAASVLLYYHLSSEKGLKRLDKLLAYRVITANLYILYLSGFKLPYFPIALIFVSKSDPNFYKSALNKLNTKPYEVLFVDDIESYLNATKVLGINTLLYDSTQKLSSQ
ncbi:MAG: hypothetical protein WCK87_01655 [Candidatus Saccharibacteria bacterium]